MASGPHTKEAGGHAPTNTSGNPESPSDVPSPKSLPSALGDRLASFCREVRRCAWLAFTYSWLNVLLVFVPVGFALSKAEGVDPHAVFTINCVAIVPLAGLLSFATESVAHDLGDARGALFNVTFGNSIELIIFIFALIKGHIRIVQASLIGSILANILLILGMAFFLGGMRYREQIYNSTVTQMNACLLSLSVTSLVLPTAFAATFGPGENTLERGLKISRGTSVMLLLVYVLYLVFQLKSHAFLYESTPRDLVDAESVPGPAVGWFESNGDNPRVSGQPADGSIQPRSAFGRLFHNAYGGGLFKRAPSKAATSQTQGHGLFSAAMARIGRRRHGTDPQRGPLEDELPLHRRARYGDGMPGCNTSTDAPSDETGGGRRLSGAGPGRFSGGVSEDAPEEGAKDGRDGQSSSQQPNTSEHLRSPLHAEDGGTLGSLAGAARGERREPEYRNTHVEAAVGLDERHDEHLGKVGALVLLISSTAGAALCAEMVVDCIEDLTAASQIGEVFIGLIILPIVGNAAEHMTSVSMALKNKMDLAIAVTVGSSIQIAIMITPLVVLLGWALDRDMTLHFTLFETACLFTSAFVVNFLVLDGRSNYLEGALLCAAYVIIAIVAFYDTREGMRAGVAGGGVGGASEGGDVAVGW